jgi:sugar phosphate isomerase/epimerase
MIALSTVYNISKHKNPASLIEEIQSLGFSAVELNVEVPASFIPEIAKKLKIVSVHNYCPKLDKIPEGKTIYSPYNFASNDKLERNTGVELTKKTIDVASDTGAEVIVFHSGEIEMEITGRILAKKYNETKGNMEYKKYLEIFLNDRKSKSRIYLDNLLKSLDEILIYADKKNIKLGIENRFWANEIPSFEDFNLIFQKLNTDSIGLWYDVGHSIIAEKQGLIKNHLDFLKTFSNRLIGMHLHDVIDVYDHKAPGLGKVDFSEISKYVKNNTMLVNEIHSSATNEDIKNSTEHLKKSGFYSYSNDLVTI